MAPTNDVFPQESQWNVSDGCGGTAEYGRSEWIAKQSSLSETSSKTMNFDRSNLTFANLSLKDDDEDKDEKKKKQTRLTTFYQSIDCTSCLSLTMQGCIIGVLLGSIVLAILLVIWLTSNKMTTTSLSTLQISSNMPLSSSATLVATVAAVQSTTSTTSLPSTTTTTTTTTTTLMSTTTTGCLPSEFGNLSRVANTNSWDPFTYNFTATKSKHLLVFGFQKGSSGNVFLDDVSAVNINQPSVELLQNPSFQNSTVVPPTGWISWCRSSCTGGATEGGVVITSGCHGGGGSNCYQGACTTGYLLLGQEFSTTVGNMYMITFWAQITGSSIVLSLDVL